MRQGHSSVPRRAGLQTRRLGGVFKPRPTIDLRSRHRLGRLLAGLALLIGLAQAAPVAAQQGNAPRTADGVSVQRVQEGLRKKRNARLDINVQYPVATFRTTVEREYLPSFKEQLRSQFQLNDLQRQSQDWASRGGGINLLQVASDVKSAWRDYRARQIRDEVTRERLALEQIVFAEKFGKPLPNLS